MSFFQVLKLALGLFRLYQDIRNPNVNVRDYQIDMNNLSLTVDKEGSLPPASKVSDEK
jgi:hypothetical protein